MKMLASSPACIIIIIKDRFESNICSENFCGENNIQCSVIHNIENTLIG